MIYFDYDLNSLLFEIHTFLDLIQLIQLVPCVYIFIYKKVRIVSFSLTSSIPNGGTARRVDSRFIDAGEECSVREEIPRRLLLLLAAVAVDSRFA